MSNAVETVTVTFEQKGGAELKRIQESIARAQEMVTKATRGTITVGDASLRQVGAWAASYKGLESRLSGVAKAQRQFYADIKALDNGVKAGVVSGEKFASTLAKIRDNYQAMGAASGRDSGAALDISKRFGIGNTVKSAEEASSAFAKMEGRLSQIRAEIDPLATAQSKLNQELAEFSMYAKMGELSAEELSKATAVANSRFEAATKHLGTAGAAVKLTGGQVQGLGYQINDMATMLAMGASPFQIISSQAGQVVQALGDGPGGMKGSIAAIATSVGAFARSLGPVGFAIGAATAAAGAMWLMSGDDKAEKAKENVSEFKSLIDGLKDSFGNAAAAGQAVFDAASAVSQTMAIGQLSDALKKANDDLKAAKEQLAGGDAVGLKTGLLGSASAVLGLLSGDLRGAQSELRTLYGEFSRGEISAKAFVEQVGQIQIAPGASDGVKALAGEMRRLGTDVMNAATNAQALQAAMDAIVNSRDRLPTPSEMDRPLRSGIERRFSDRADPAAMDELREGLKTQSDELKKATEAGDEYTKGVKDRAQATRDSVVALELELKAVGMSTSEAAALRFEFEAVTEAKRAAAEAGQIVSAEELAYIKEAAGRVGEFTAAIDKAREAKQQLEAMKAFESDLSFDIEQAGRSDIDQEVFASLRQLKVDYDSLDGQRIAGSIRYRDEVEKLNDQMQDSRDLAKDFTQTLIDGLSSGEGAMKSVTSAFAAIGAPLSADGLDRLFKENQL